jgi:hypothetical protein
VEPAAISIIITSSVDYENMMRRNWSGEIVLRQIGNHGKVYHLWVIEVARVVAVVGTKW